MSTFGTFTRGTGRPSNIVASGMVESIEPETRDVRARCLIEGEVGDDRAEQRTEFERVPRTTRDEKTSGNAANGVDDEVLIRGDRVEARLRVCHLSVGDGRK